MSTSITVKCPRCDASICAQVRVDPGEPMVRYYPDGSGYPGYPPSIEEIEDIEYDCDCLDEASREGGRSAYEEQVENLIFDAEFTYDPEDYYTGPDRLEDLD